MGVTNSRRDVVGKYLLIVSRPIGKYVRKRRRMLRDVKISIPFESLGTCLARDAEVPDPHSFLILIFEAQVLSGWTVLYD